MPSQTDTLLAVEGMTCPSCVSHVKKALLEVSGVESVDVRFSQRKVHVRHDAAAAPLPHLVEALAEAGYPATPAS